MIVSPSQDSFYGFPGGYSQTDEEVFQPFLPTTAELLDDGQLPSPSLEGPVSPRGTSHGVTNSRLSVSPSEESDGPDPNFSTPAKTKIKPKRAVLKYSSFSDSNIGTIAENELEENSADSRESDDTSSEKHVSRDSSKEEVSKLTQRQLMQESISRGMQGIMTRVVSETKQVSSPAGARIAKPHARSSTAPPSTLQYRDTDERKPTPPHKRAIQVRPLICSPVVATEFKRYPNFVFTPAHKDQQLSGESDSDLDRESHLGDASLSIDREVDIVGPLILEEEGKGKEGGEEEESESEGGEEEDEEGKEGEGEEGESEEEEEEEEGEGEGEEEEEEEKSEEQREAEKSLREEGEAERESLEESETLSEVKKVEEMREALEESIQAREEIGEGERGIEEKELKEGVLTQSDSEVAEEDNILEERSVSIEDDIRIEVSLHVESSTAIIREQQPNLMKPPSPSTDSPGSKAPLDISSRDTHPYHPSAEIPQSSSDHESLSEEPQRHFSSALSSSTESANNQLHHSRPVKSAVNLSPANLITSRPQSARAFSVEHTFASELTRPGSAGHGVALLPDKPSYLIDRELHRPSSANMLSCSSQSIKSSSSNESERLHLASGGAQQSVTRAKSPQNYRTQMELVKPLSALLRRKFSDADTHQQLVKSRSMASNLNKNEDSKMADDTKQTRSTTSSPVMRRSRTETPISRRTSVTNLKRPHSFHVSKFQSSSSAASSSTVDFTKDEFIRKAALKGMVKKSQTKKTPQPQNQTTNSKSTQDLRAVGLKANAKEVVSDLDALVLKRRTSSAGTPRQTPTLVTRSTHSIPCEPLTHSTPREPQFPPNSLARMSPDEQASATRSDRATSENRTPVAVKRHSSYEATLDMHPNSTNSSLTSNSQEYRNSVENIQASPNVLKHQTPTKSNHATPQTQENTPPKRPLVKNRHSYREISATHRNKALKRSKTEASSLLVGRSRDMWETPVEGGISIRTLDSSPYRDRRGAARPTSAPVRQNGNVDYAELLQDDAVEMSWTQF